MTTHQHQHNLPMFEDAYDALRELVRAAGGSKTVGQWLFPHLPVEEAKNKVNDCLNRNRRDKFDAEQVIALLRKGQEIGYHHAKHYLDELTGYQASQPLSPADEQANLVRVIQDASAVLKGATERLDRLSRAPLATVASGKSAA